MLRHKLSSPKGRLLLSVLMLKDADPNYYAVPGVDCVVSHEPRHFADDGHKALLGHLHHLLRVGHALEAPHCNVHSFCAPSFLTRLRETAGSEPFHHKQDATSRSSLQCSESTSVSGSGISAPPTEVFFSSPYELEDAGYRKFELSAAR